jgi:pimeloyl-ACP methyl ester carboxylesterase
MQGLLPGWPGADIYPPQPMIDQTRAVLEKYMAAGSSYSEVVLENTGHIPFIERPGEFNGYFHQHLRQ